MFLSILLSLSLLTASSPKQCFLESASLASKVEIVKPFKILKGKHGTSRRFLQRLYKEVSKRNGGSIDPRFFALAWMESRLRPRPRIGDRGRACGIYQIHARHSYPMFRRKRGYVGWDDQSPESKRVIRRECGKLRTTSYAVETLSRLLNIFDEKDLPPCHHNSGIYGKCNPWYEERVDFWVGYFTVANILCSEKVLNTMAMMRTGTPVATAPTDKVQGYLDYMAGKEPQKSDDEVYMSGYTLAEKVKKGEEVAPVWAT
tara:strand:- start:2898 stop:3674 length:777 start_codon:yes stop_codon:yes gene_type:complete